ncbi:MAG TPA: hypothetical protein VHU40_03065 [Polyangia bacterium]|jgi:hypothetical protein|nr:hypothetical protein [Polyangia bacterium]
MPLLIRLLVMIFGRFGSFAAVIGTMVNCIAGGIIVALSFGLAPSLDKIRAIHDTLQAPLQGAFYLDYYRIADLYLPLTECIELTAIAITTAGTVLLVRVLLRAKTGTEAKSPIGGG